MWWMSVNVVDVYSMHDNCLLMWWMSVNVVDVYSMHDNCLCVEYSNRGVETLLQNSLDVG